MPNGRRDHYMICICPRKTRGFSCSPVKLLQPLQVPSMSFDVAKFSPSWVTKGSPSYIGRAGESGWGRNVPTGTKTGAHTTARCLLPVDKQENLTNVFHPMAVSGSTFIRYRFFNCEGGPINVESVILASSLEGVTENGGICFYRDSPLLVCLFSEIHHAKLDEGIYLGTKRGSQREGGIIGQCDMMPSSRYSYYIYSSHW